MGSARAYRAPGTRCISSMQPCREIAVQLEKLRFGPPRLGDVADGGIGARKTVPRCRIVGRESQRVGECANGGILTVEALQRGSSDAQRLGVAGIRGGPPLGELDQLAPASFDAQRCRAHEIRQRRVVAFPERQGIMQRMDVLPLILGRQAVADPSHRQRIVVRALQAKCQESDQRARRIEQAAAARTRRERGIRLDDARAIQRVQRTHVAHADFLARPAGEADRGDGLPRVQRIRHAENRRLALPGGRMKEAEIVVAVGILSRDVPKHSVAGDSNRRGISRDVTVRHDDRGADRDAAADRQTSLRALGLHADDAARRLQTGQRVAAPGPTRSARSEARRAFR